MPFHQSLLFTIYLFFIDDLVIQLPHFNEIFQGQGLLFQGQAYNIHHSSYSSISISMPLCPVFNPCALLIIHH